MGNYERVIEHVFHQNFHPGAMRVSFEREDLVRAHRDLDIARTRNIGDIPYSFRFRRALPQSIQSTAPPGSEWIIAGAGTAQYEFRLACPGKIEPTPNRLPVKIPDATPEIVRQYAPGTDEQALLTRARYNRLIDLFTGLTCYSIQNHLRTTVAGVGQIEVDEIYLGVSKRGAHYVIPCQAKSPGDRFGIVQVMQDTALCRERYPHALCRPIALQFLAEDDVAILELTVKEEGTLFRLNVVDERHYRLVPRAEITSEELLALLALEPE